MKLIVGDVVKVINKYDFKYKKIGIIICVSKNDVPYLVDIDGEFYWESEKSIELVKEDPKKKEILNDDEKAYLGNIIKPKAIHDKVIYIRKMGLLNNDLQFIVIGLWNEDIALPMFNNKTMYKGMIKNKKYNLGELGIDEYLARKGGKIE